MRAALFTKDGADSEGGVAMLDALRKMGTSSAPRAPLLPGDRRRIVRARWRYTPSRADRHGARRGHAVLFRLLRYYAARIVLNYADRVEFLCARIDARVDKMNRRRPLNEVKALLLPRLGPECTAMQAIGLQRDRRALEGENEPSREAADLIKQQPPPLCQAADDMVQALGGRAAHRWEGSARF